MIKKGDAFLLRHPGKEIQHLFIAISEPKEQVLLVNVTKKKQNSDCSCELNVGDHPFITQPSVINYADAMLSVCQSIEDWLNITAQDLQPPMPQAILQKIIDGAKNSPALKPKYLPLL